MARIFCSTVSLRQVTHAEARALVHGQSSNVALLETNRSAVGLEDTDDHVEGGSFAGAIGTQQSDDFAGSDLDRNAIDDAPLLVGFDEVIGGDEAHGTRYFG